MYRSDGLSMEGVEQRLRQSETRVEACLQLLRRLHHAVAVLDEEARIVVASAAFEQATCNCGGCVTVRNGAVEAPTRQKAFERMLCRAQNGCAGAAAAATLEIVRNGRTCTINLLPLPSSGGSENTKSHVALFLIGQCGADAASAAGLQDRFEFTGAETRLAMALMAGESLDTASRRLGVSLTTARSHLQAVFRKTGTHRQADLLRVLLSAPV